MSLPKFIISNGIKNKDISVKIIKKEFRTVDEYISSFSEDEHHRCGSHLLSYVYETTTELRLTCNYVMYHFLYDTNRYALLRWLVLIILPTGLSFIAQLANSSFFLFLLLLLSVISISFISVSRRRFYVSFCCICITHRIMLAFVPYMPSSFSYYYSRL